MVTPGAKDGEIDAPVPPIRHFEWSDGLGSAPSALSMRGIPLCSKFSLNWEDAAVIFHLAVLLLQLFLGCTNENMRDEDDAAEAL
jgi:hypothetical protein